MAKIRKVEVCIRTTRFGENHMREDGLAKLSVVKYGLAERRSVKGCSPQVGAGEIDFCPISVACHGRGKVDVGQVAITLFGLIFRIVLRGLVQDYCSG